MRLKQHLIHLPAFVNYNPFGFRKMQTPIREACVHHVQQLVIELVGLAESYNLPQVLYSGNAVREGRIYNFIVEESGVMILFKR